MRDVVWSAIVAALGTTALVTTWNALAACSGSVERLELGRPLIGKEEHAIIPSFGWRRFASHEYQAEVQRLGALSVPLRSLLVRAHNEILFSVFQTSPSPTVLIGRQGYLVGRHSLQRYCRRRLSTYMPQLEKRVAELRALQAHHEARQRTFLYVITPSKASGMPEHFTHLVDCPAPAAERENFIPSYVAMLREAGIRVVETTSLMKSLHMNGTTPFPVGGMHWNMLGAAHGTQAIIRAANQAQGPLLPELRWQTQLASGALFEDNDMAVGLNLFRERLPPSTRVAFAAGPCPAGKISVTLVATSFGVQLVRALSATQCFLRGRYFFSLTELYVTFPPYEEVASGPLPLDFVEPLLDGDLILVEENEQLLPEAEHVTTLFELQAAR